MSPAHRSPERRWLVLALVVVVVVGVGIAAGARGTPSPVGAPATARLRWSARPTRSRPPGTARGSRPGRACRPASLVLTNTRRGRSTATITAVTDSGAVVHTARRRSRPAASAAPAIPPLSSGSWEAETVTLSGGGVAVTQAVHGASGWSQAPCQSTTAADWYFPGGTTANSDPLYVSLLNPTSTPVVVDLSFVTPAGTVHPSTTRGSCCRPGQVQVENVASEVQNVSDGEHRGRHQDRAGRRRGGAGVLGGVLGGLALVPGAAHAESHWAIPQSQDVTGRLVGDRRLQPRDGPESVTVHLRLASGPLAPLTDTVAPGTTWALATGAQTRIPHGATYSAAVDATGGPGVVVGRTVVPARRRRRRPRPAWRWPWTA